MADAHDGDVPVEAGEAERGKCGRHITLPVFESRHRFANAAQQRPVGPLEVDAGLAFSHGQNLQRLSAGSGLCRNDEVTVEQVVDLDPELIIISPGPGDPESLFTEQGVGLVGQCVAVRGMRSRVSAEGLVAA